MIKKSPPAPAAKAKPATKKAATKKVTPAPKKTTTTRAKKAPSAKTVAVLAKKTAVKKPVAKKPKALSRGRPTAYKPEYCQMMRDYFVIDVSKAVEVNVGGGKTETRHITNTFPTLTRFAVNIGVSRDTLYEWALKKDEQGNLVYPDFSDALTCAQDMQETLMIEGGLSGHYESKFLTFLAPNISRLKNKVETVSEVMIAPIDTEKMNDFYAEKIKEMEAGKRAVSGRIERMAKNG